MTVARQSEVKLVYRGVLGAGSYKTVYLVTAGAGPGALALAVERLPNVNVAREELRGISVAQELQRSVPPEQRRLFERIDDWWLQSSPTAAFVLDAPVAGSDDPPHRFTKLPTRLLRPVWLLSLKPVYDMDLDVFRTSAPVPPTLGQTQSFSGLPLDDEGALRLAMNLCTAGRLLHERNLIHKDIKPKNIMLQNGLPVLIDFGFAQASPAVTPRSASNTRPNQGERKRVCVSGADGEVNYVLAEDVWRIRACREGDQYAMGKTLFEVIFDFPPPPGSPDPRRGTKVLEGGGYVTGPAARRLNDEFRQRLASPQAGTLARFRMTPPVSTALLGLVRGLCEKSEPISFADAELQLAALVAMVQDGRATQVRAAPRRQA